MRRKDPSPSRIVLSGLLALLLLGACFRSLALAGSGVVNNDGTIDFTASFRFPPTADDIDDVKQAIIDASHVLWDASEGQLRFGEVTFICGAVNEDLADMWLMPQSGRAYASAACDGSSIETAGKRVVLFSDDWDANTIAHEFAHLALGIRDEYAENGTRCIGKCIEDWTPQTANLMQSSGGGSEFCTDANHDTVQGDGIDCATQPVPGGCDTGCERYNWTTMAYETTSHTWGCGDVSGWSHLENNFGFITAPVGLPQADEPPGHIDPVFIENCEASDTALLVLDASGSMRWSVNGDNVEVCDNGVDDDSDGSVDEDECTSSRLEYLKAAARGWLQLANGQGVRAGIISFDCLPTLEEPIQDVDGASIAGLLNSVDTLVAGGDTGIGNALASSALLLGAETDAVNKTVFLMSDGHETCGSDPLGKTALLNAEGIRVFAISTGSASDSGLLGDVSGQTGGAPLDAADPRTLVNAFVQQWSRYRNGGVLIPLLPYQATAEDSSIPVIKGVEKALQINEAALIQPLNFPIANLPPQRPDAIPFLVEDGTESVVVTLAGNLDNMDGFGVSAKLIGPAGPNPNSFDTNMAHPLLRVVQDSFFLMVELVDPNPGMWYVDVDAKPGAALVQTGNVTIVTSNPRTDLFTGLSKHVLSDPSDSVDLNVMPSYVTAIQGAQAAVAQLRRPDGSTVAIPLNEQDEDFEGYQAVISGEMPFQGLYQVLIGLRTGAGAYNHPGEPLFSGSPDNSVPVPDLLRFRTETFYVIDGKKPCPSGNREDCDGDGILDESEVNDADKDGWPDACDPDSDNDEIPDSVEWKGQPTDLDRDGTPDHLDPDADGDGINDSDDPNIAISRPTYEAGIDGGTLTPCGLRRFFVRVSSEERFKGFSIGLRWGAPSPLRLDPIASPGYGMEIVEVKPGPDVKEKPFFFSVKIEDPVLGLGAGEAMVALALQPTDPNALLPAGQNLRVLEVLARARPDAKIGSSVRVCVVDGIGDPVQNTVLSVFRSDTTVSVRPVKGCDDLLITPDRTPPRILCPDDIVLPCAGPDGAVVKYEVRAEDDCGAVRVVCFPPSGSHFAPGIHTVLCRATDEAGNASYCRFTVRVGDQRPPAIVCPDDIIVPCAGPNGAIVEYEAKAFDNCSRDVRLICEPPSGSSFPIGVTEVRCVATDEAGNRSVCRFLVSVEDGECFKRGDSNSDNLVDITDSINTLAYMFLGTVQLGCPDAADFDDSGVLDITDPLATLGALFLGTTPAPAPGSRNCGADPTPDRLMSCQAVCR